MVLIRKGMISNCSFNWFHVFNPLFVDWKSVPRHGNVMTDILMCWAQVPPDLFFKPILVIYHNESSASSINRQSTNHMLCFGTNPVRSLPSEFNKWVSQWRIQNFSEGRQPIVSQCLLKNRQCYGFRSEGRQHIWPNFPKKPTMFMDSPAPWKNWKLNVLK